MDENVSLSWNNYSNSFLENLKNFQNKGCLCDSTIACQGEFYPVHRLVLSLCSEYFEKIFERTPCKHPFIIVKDIEPTILEALLNFIYHGEVQVSKINLNDFMKAAETLKIKVLLPSASQKANHKKNGNFYKLVNNTLNVFDSPKNPILEEINERNNINIIENLSPTSTNTKQVSLPINFNVPTLKRKIKPTKKRNNRKRSKTKPFLKSKVTKPEQLSKTNKIKAKKIDLTPTRKSSRESVSKVSYYIPDEELDDPDSEISSRENGTSKISVASYSGGNSDELDTSHAINDEEAENITIKMESTDYILDDISDFSQPNLEDDDMESINTSRTEPSQDSYADVLSQDNGVDMARQFRTYNDLVNTMAGDVNKHCMAPSLSLITKKNHPFVRDYLSDEALRPDYVCPFCSKRCLMKSLYHCHLRKHTGERPFACPHCDYKATQKHHIKGHIERRHKDI